MDSTQKGPKIFELDFGPPLMRLDFEAGHGPENHIQFGHNTYTERHGEEAKDLFSRVLLAKLGVDLGE